MNNQTSQFISRLIIGGSLLFTTTLMTSTMAFAAQSVEQEMTVNAKPQIELKVQRGKVEIIGWDKDLITVSGQLDELSEGFIFEQKGNQITIEDKLPNSYRGHDEDGSNLVIKLPIKLMLEAEGVSADYKIENLSGEIDLALVSGNLKANHMDGDIKLQTVSGNIESDKLNGKLELETVSGDIKDKSSAGKAQYRLVSGELESKDNQVTKLSIDQVSGDIEGNFSAVEKIKIVSVSGDIDISLSAKVTKASFDTVSGDVEVKFTQMPNLTFEIDGGPGGDINNELTDDKPLKTKYSARESIQFTTGDATGKFSVNTISGNIELK
ncbi:DUF4097 domain-containing protein [Pseudomonadota bacterium]|uniref:DUF4097 family beta strand repeat-containing protein n=1 Tax=unclassified Shewanella TaxID=196818 RepID=UPI001F5300F9|nr:MULTISPECIES: DUF4097 family beta strand repeat-containing protein [unclassified Shewanella]MDO6620365.1 DUF4097 family beta strand repeat-containing protein [Shewanella sp. 6_MG-2023]MDO6639696.1 DUF4097 family beta strand repeat-containing protein [Shewanella sp. 5_MG-2023]MDO6677677.1 DUF4097 family beta strand repeat-containing protein [Shewanella sp. 4_MG-2023]MDO6776837.1 DUF4097 family beta strand repeat-containing protein [Shewanella sp. 3_MG-2023]